VSLRGSEPQPEGRTGSRPETARARLSDVLAGRRGPELEEMHRFWSGAANGGPPPSEAELRRELAALMCDPDRVEARLSGLGRRLNQMLSLHLEAPGYQRSLEDLAAHKLLAYLSDYDLEAATTALVRHGLLVETLDRRLETYGGRSHAVPAEIGDAILRLRRARRRGVFDLFTLRGFLDRLYDDPARTRRLSPTRLREMYKLYSGESASVQRLERLEPPLRELVEKAVLQFGGLLPRGLFERMEAGEQGWDGRRWRLALEESLVGTVERLELGRYGIHLCDDVLVVFNEVARAGLKRVAVPGDPDSPHSEASLGVDLASNLSRFIGFILEHSVRFTVRGEIFKTTEKRILQELIPNPGRELSRAAVLAFIYDFARAAGLIESTGERTFALTSAGRAWEPRPLEDKLSTLLEYCVEERRLPGDYYHQLRLRRIFIRLLKRVEPLVWYDLMYLPFLARNTYLASLDQLAVDEYFAARSQAAHYAPMEDLQRLAWNLARWVRQRLYLLGIVDLGYDAAGRPVALRLTKQGARLLGVIDGTPQTIRPSLGSVIVTPDFEVVLFPTGDDGELIHELDRFCVREKAGETMHFKILERSVQRALAEGMYVSRILAILRERSRTPVPQNVVYSIRDWAHRAGLMVLDAAGVVRCEDEATLRRFQQDPGVRPYLRGPIDERRVQLKTRFTPRRTQALLRDLGYLVELEG
jgi:hypothetical protein